MADIIFPGEATDGVIGSSRLPTNVDLEWWKGDAQEFFISLTNDQGEAIDLSGYTPSAVVKSSFNSLTSYAFTTTIQNTNQVRIYLSSATSKTIPAGDYIWNFQLTNPSGDVRTYLAGDVTVFAEVD